MRRIPESRVERPRVLSDLATLLRDRYRQTDNDDDLAKYNKNDRNVLSLYLSGHSEYADACTELAVGPREYPWVHFMARFSVRREPEDLDQAISLYRRALALRSPGHAERHNCL
ncbi:hypothetical protein PISMIDRAFT_93534 [Pisolithus microcarpus 441]|uniref:Unplaced genomic scaffold scaffold_13, whole genome shotgun sequence n=1 Tax=Pisolithus microcarpus 441 TaxID=765257 RepID=A0A0C9ZN10_9AGAM|nr:hypothetical protein BKA83DRAFT_93534 [Pisolithus microcarpus]KIK27299.1 hypothetical protein PISMIDRAFT_93534 [Pisolithus microcarpus 441]